MYSEKGPLRDVPAEGNRPKSIRPYSQQNSSAKEASSEGYIHKIAYGTRRQEWVIILYETK